MIDHENLRDTETQLSAELRSSEVVLGGLSVAGELVAPDVDLIESAPVIMSHTVEASALFRGSGIEGQAPTGSTKIDSSIEPVTELTPKQLAHIEDHLELAFNIARKFMNKGEPFDDLNQAARLGLVRSARRFDPERGVPFAVFATSCIYGELKKHFRDSTWSVKVDRRTLELRPNVNTTQQDLTQILGREPTISEIATVLKVTFEEVKSATLANAAYKASSLDRAISAGTNGGDFYGVLGSTDDELRIAEFKLLISGLLTKLNDREATVLRAKFGLHPYDKPHTQEEICKFISTSEPHVGRIASVALHKLKCLLSDTTYSDLLI